jgi:hypothetical protein
VKQNQARERPWNGEKRIDSRPVANVRSRETGMAGCQSGY